MSKEWQKMDLEGAGVQALSLMLARFMASRAKAYALWVLFPLGAHRFYLGERISGAIYLALTVSTAGVWWTVGGLFPLVTAVPMVGMALYDLYRLDDRVAEYNKALRKSLYLRGGTEAAPPKDFSGRFNDAGEHEAVLDDYVAEKEGRETAEGRKRVPSLNEQEAMLKAMQKGRGKPSGREEDSSGSQKTD